MALQGLRRRVVHALSFEAIAIALLTVGMSLFGLADAQQGFALSLALSVTAMSWNMVFNALFERWEARQVSRARTLTRRVAHALGFEGGLMVLTVPIIAHMLGIGWWEALLADLAMMAFFLVYTFAFNWVFDHLFGLPDLGPAPPSASP
jgi:uncharacterized membrane protein